MSSRDPFSRYGRGAAGEPEFPFRLPQPSWKWAAAAGALILAWAVLSSAYTVQPEQRGVVKRFGAVVYQTDPGLHFKLPFGIDTVEIVPTERVLKEEFGFRTRQQLETSTRYDTSGLDEESLTLSGDLNIIRVEWVVQYRIADPIRWLYRVRAPEHTLRDVAEAVMRQIVGNRLGSEVLTVGRVEIAAQARAEMQEIMDGYESGVTIITVELQDVLPTARVQPAFNEVNIARQERERMINEAEKRKNQIIPKVRGQANQLVAEAEGYAAERVNRARGEVARFTAILGEYRQFPEVTRRRMFLETVGAVLPKAGQMLIVQNGQTDPLPLLELGGAGARGRAAVEGAK